MSFPEKYRALKNNTFSAGEYSIVPIRYEDRFKIMQWRNEQLYHLRQAKPLTEENQESYFKTIVAKLFEAENPNQLLFSYLKNNECIGYGGLVHINWIDKNAEISFIMDTKLEKDEFEKHWKIYLRLIEEVAFKELGLHKIFTYAFDIRQHLYKAIENSGYHKEAVLKEHCLFNGKFIDVIYHSKINTLSLRKTTIEDTETTYKWAKDKKIRKYAFQISEIQKKEHINWFSNKIQEPNCYYYILEDRLKNKLGSIRIDINNQVGLISYLIDSEFFGRGLGAKIVQLLEAKVYKENIPITELVGYVMEENIASIKIFNKLGYEQQNEIEKLKFVKKLEGNEK